MRSVKIDYSKGSPCISKEEYLELKESIKGTFDANKKSVLNIALTKQEAFDILFNDKWNQKTYIGYIHLFNIVREFVIEKKTFRSWKILDNYKIIKDIKDLRKDKINEINKENI